ncbi:BrnA antitoxin family protein [Caenimonas terrae]|uniref:BrnA antitoxin family protein n=1 Tax=Caenimonas terrae TaxID=696074 RepID=A0ABW0NIT7_9BURK
MPGALRSPPGTVCLAMWDACRGRRARRQEGRVLPELTEDMLARATVNKDGRPVLPHPRKLQSFRLPADVIGRWKASGPGWQTRMAQRVGGRGLPPFPHRRQALPRRPAGATGHPVLPCATDNNARDRQK